MIQRSIFALVSVCSISALVFAVGCAAPTAGDEEGTTAQDLSSTAGGPSTGSDASATGPTTSTGGGVTDPLCIEHHIHESICIFDWELRAEALTICGAKHLDGLTYDKPCDVPSTGGVLPPATGAGGEPEATTAAARATDVVPIIDPQPSARGVSFACCNVEIDPKPVSAAERPSTSAP